MACEDGEPTGSGPRRPWKSTNLVRLGIIAYAVLVVTVTVLPIRWDPWRHHYPTDDYRPQLRPLRGSGTNPLQSGDPLHMLGEHVGNVLLFAPYGLLLPLRWPQLKRPWRLIGLGAVTSLGIELAQIAMPGIHRADIDDVLLNTVGVALGWLALRLARRAGAHRQARP